MRLWPFGRSETRTSIENPSVSLTDPTALQALLFNQFMSNAGINVDADKALEVPAIWCAINFIAGTLASLPLQEFKKTAEGRERTETTPVARLLSGPVNVDGLTSFKWRRQSAVSLLLTGAGRSWIEKNQLEQPIGLWPLETKRTNVVRKTVDGQVRTFYEYLTPDSRKITYGAGEIIDLTWLSIDGVTPIDPVQKLRDTIGLSLALERYAARFFQNGGVPPLQLIGPAASPQAMKRAGSDVDAAVRNAHAENRNVLYLPTGHELKAIGFDPEKGQMVEAQRFCVEQVARLFNIPPTFLHDLSRGTYSNTEQQDLHFVKHTLTHWVSLWEQELNAKFYGPRMSRRYVEFNLNGLLRGDFKTRMEGYAQAIQNGVLQPNEARRLENLPDAEGGDRLFVNGATVPIGKAGEDDDADDSAQAGSAAEAPDGKDAPDEAA